jgi:transcriptional regulator with XRE-family HTH domain
MELHEKLKLLRTLHGLTQQNVAEKFYISRQAVQKWECGETAPDISKLYDLSTTYKISVDDLLNPELDKKHINKLYLNPGYDFQQEELSILTVLKNPSRIDYLIIAIIVVSSVFIIVLLHLLGLIFAIVNLISIIALLTSSVYFTINFFFNLQNGIPTLFMILGCVLISFSSSYMIYLFFKWLLEIYTSLAKTIFARFKEYNLLKEFVLNEKD